MTLAGRKVRALARDTAGNLAHDATATLATVLTTAVALTLLGVAMLASAQIGAMKDRWYDKVEVAVFLCTDESTAATCNGVPSPAVKAALYDALVALPGVESVFYESQADAWAAFTERYAGTGVTETVTAAALPESFRVKMTDPDNGRSIELAAAGVEGIESVQDQRRILSRFFGLLAKVQAAAGGTAAAALLAALVLIAAGVRATVAYRRDEIAIMRLVGAHAGKIRRPFLAASVVQGAVGGLLAGFAVLLFKGWLIDGQAAGTSFSRNVSWETAVGISGSLVIGGAVLSAIVAAATIARHLRD